MLTIKEIWNQFGSPISETKKQVEKTELIKSLESCVSGSDFTPFYNLLKQKLQISQVHDSVKAYIESSSVKENLPGPTKFKSCKAYFNFIDFQDLFPNSYDRLFPAFYINSDLWLIIPTGELLSLNHDATFYEVGTEILGGATNFEAFINEFSAYGSQLDLNKRFYFETELSKKGLDDFRRLSEEQQKKVLNIYLDLLGVNEKDFDFDDLDEDVKIACMEYLETAGLY